jgi:hypothetical protein
MIDLHTGVTPERAFASAEADTKNLRAVRAHNERRLEFEPASDDGSPVPLVCECDDLHCFRAVVAPRALAAAVHATHDQSLVIPGHGGSGLDVVLTRHAGCWVVIRQRPGRPPIGPAVTRGDLRRLPTHKTPSEAERSSAVSRSM